MKIKVKTQKRCATVRAHVCFCTKNFLLQHNFCSSLNYAFDCNCILLGVRTENSFEIDIKFLHNTDFPHK